MKLRNNLGTSFNQDIMTTLTLVDLMIKPILLYNLDFWGCMKLPKNNPIENLHVDLQTATRGPQEHNEYWGFT